MGAVTADVVSKRKPFPVGARVERQADGERGTVESVQQHEGVWAVGVRMDSDGAVWSGTQKTAARGAWTRLSGNAPHAEHCPCAACVEAEQSAPFTVEMPTPLLDEGTLYLAFDRYVCGRVRCAGHSAVYTGVTIGGAPVVPVTPEEVKAWGEEFGAPIVCQCGAVTASFAPNTEPQIAPRKRTVAEALALVEERSAVLRAQEEQKQENGAQNSAQHVQRGQRCQWVGCENRSRTVRRLAGKRWSVCLEHDGSAL